MTTNPVAAATASSGAVVSSSDANVAAAQLTGDFSFFLKMLTTQLQNQDPTNPMDVDQMSQQIAQFSEVEQQVQTNSNLTTLINSNKQSQLSTAVGYIGKEVDVTGNSSTMLGSEAVFSYNLPSAATNATITITDSGGNTVFSGQALGNSGNNVVLWDGINSSTGAQEPDGTYTFSVTATDGSGAAVAPTTFSTGTVTSVQTDSSGNVLLMSGAQQFNFNNILAVRQPPAPLSSGTSSS